MTKVVVSMLLSLDGFTVGPREEMDWVISKFDMEGMGLGMSKVTAGAQAFLMGRQTYKIMASAWPSQTEATSPGADVMNRTSKLVASNTLKEAPGEVRERDPAPRLPGARDPQTQTRPWKDTLPSESQACTEPSRNWTRRFVPYLAAAHAPR